MLPNAQVLKDWFHGDPSGKCCDFTKQGLVSGLEIIVSALLGA